MPELALQRVMFTQDADSALRMLKARTGITPNILCRMALGLSLDEPGLPSLVSATGKSTREINRYTLMGEHDRAYVALFFASLRAAGGDLTRADDYFIAHVHRGITLLTTRLRSLEQCQDLAKAESAS